MDHTSYTNDVGAPGWLSPVEQATRSRSCEFEPRVGGRVYLKKMYTYTPK